MTSRKNQLFANVHGMSYDRPDLIPSNKWRTQRNMRWIGSSFEQTERKQIVAQIELGHFHEFTYLGTLPTSQQKRNVVFGLTKHSAYYISDEGTTITRLLYAGAPVTFNYTERYERWDTTTYNGYCWFINTQNACCYTDGIEVRKLGGECPSGRYVEVFYDHLVIGAPVINGAALENRIIFSDLYNFEKFVPKTTNEVGSRDTTDYDNQSASVTGITGMKRLGNALITFTDSCVYATSYVGLPHIFQTNPLKEGVGNSYHNAVVSTGDSLYFISATNRQFYKLDANGIQPIGDPIQDYFFPILETFTSRAPLIWGYHDPTFNEIWWVFANNPVSPFDQWPVFEQAVVYNYKLNEWYIATPEDVHSFVQAAGTAQRYEDVVTPYDTLHNLALSELGTFTPTQKLRLWGGRFGRLLGSATEFGEALATQLPQLETGDFTYETITEKKEHDVLELNANGPVTVEVSAREQLNSVVNYVTVGVWTPENPVNFNWSGSHGKVFRFRFTPVEQADGSTTQVHEATPGREMSIFEEGFNGSVTALAVRPDMKIYVAGNFTSYKGTPANGIVRLNDDGTVDTAFNAGVGFAGDVTYSPPTQLEVAKDGGVWCALSVGRMVEYYGTRKFDTLKFNGVEVGSLVRLSPTGLLAYQEMDATKGADTFLRFGGVQVKGDDVVFTYIRRGTSTGNMNHVTVTKKTNDVLVKRRILTGNTSFAAAVLTDVVIQNDQIFWLMGTPLVGGPFTGVIDETGASVMAGTSFHEKTWKESIKLSAIVMDFDFNASSSWVHAGVNEIDNQNKIVNTYRAEKGTKNNVYWTYVPQQIPPNPVGFLDGKWGMSLPWQHRGMYQHNLGALDTYIPEIPGTTGFQTVVNVYPSSNVADPHEWDPVDIFVGTSTRLKLHAEQSGIGSMGSIVVMYGGISLFDGFNIAYTTNDSFKEAYVQLDGSADHITVSGRDSNYFLPSHYSMTSITLSWEADTIPSQSAPGDTDADAWNLQPTPESTQAESGFTATPEAVLLNDEDATKWYPQPLGVFANTYMENLYVAGDILQFKGQAVPKSDIWAVNSDGVLQENFLLLLNNAALCVDGVQRRGKTLCVKQWGDYLLIGGRFTEISKVLSGNISFVDPLTAKAKRVIVVDDGTLNEIVAKGNGCQFFNFYGYEQKLFTVSAEQ